MKRQVRKLRLNKETIRRLTDQELKGVAGGATNHTCSCTCACPTSDPDCTDCCRTQSGGPCIITCPGTC